MGEAKNRGNFEKRKTEAIKRVAIDLSTIPDHPCICGCSNWKGCLRVKRVSRLLSGQPDDQWAVRNVIVCDCCGAILPNPEDAPSLLVKSDVKILR